MRIFCFVFSALVFFTACNNETPAAENSEQQASEAVSRNSAAFNQAVDAALNTYYALTNAFVNWDSAKIPALSQELESRLSAISINEHKTDTASEKATKLMSEAKKAAMDMSSASNLTQARHALNSLTENLFGFLNAAAYDRRKLYLQVCPMAFNDTDPGVWISRENEIKNPYLGLHHPYYKSGMLECGENKEVLNYSSAK